MSIVTFNTLSARVRVCSLSLSILRQAAQERPVLAKCLDGLVASLKIEVSGFGTDIAVDATDLVAAFANGQRFVSQGGRKR